MPEMSNPLRSRWFVGALCVCSFVASGCDGEGSKDQPMRSMQQTPLPRVTTEALEERGALAAEGSSPGAQTVSGPHAGVQPGAQRSSDQDSQPKVRGEKAVSGEVKAAAEGAEFSVKRLVLTTSIRDKEPVPTQAFEPDGTPVFAFVELSNPSDADAKIEIVFEHESGRQVGFVKLDVPGQSERWRTWGKTRQIRQKGRWVAVVRSGDGQELMRKSFAVGAG